MFGLRENSGTIIGFFILLSPHLRSGWISSIPAGPQGLHLSQCV